VEKAKDIYQNQSFDLLHSAWLKLIFSVEKFTKIGAKVSNKLVPRNK